MSIGDKIKHAISDGRLHRYVPAFPDPDFRVERHIFMSQEAWQQCPPSGPSSIRSFRGLSLDQARADLEAFVVGDEIVEDEDLKRLQPKDKEVWEIRVIGNRHVRLIGWFAAPDNFVITHCELRDKLKSDEDWERTIEKCDRKRREQLNDLPVFHGSKFTDYVTRRGVPAE
jgi:hypothetical protein